MLGQENRGRPPGTNQEAWPHGLLFEQVASTKKLPWWFHGGFRACKQAAAEGLRLFGRVNPTSTAARGSVRDSSAPGPGPTWRQTRDFSSRYCSILAPSMAPRLLKWMSMYFPKRLELSLRMVLAFPKASGWVEGHGHGQAPPSHPALPCGPWPYLPGWGWPPAPAARSTSAAH